MDGVSIILLGGPEGPRPLDVKDPSVTINFKSVGIEQKIHIKHIIKKEISLGSVLFVPKAANRGLTMLLL